MPRNEASRPAREIAACPDIPNPNYVAHLAQTDAMDLATDLRDLDPRQVWGRLALMLDADPLRLIALAWAAAAMVDIDRPANDLLAWTNRTGAAA
jgi:hypothetical protein